MIKKSFLFHVKSFFVIKIFKFLSWPFYNAGKRLVKKAKVNFKIYDIADRKQIITTHILPKM